jgi:hypothetical protein
VGHYKYNHNPSNIKDNSLILIHCIGILKGMPTIHTFSTSDYNNLFETCNEHCPDSHILTEAIAEAYLHQDLSLEAIRTLYTHIKNDERNQGHHMVDLMTVDLYPDDILGPGESHEHILTKEFFEAARKFSNNYPAHIAIEDYKDIASPTARKEAQQTVRFAMRHDRRGVWKRGRQAKKRYKRRNPCTSGRNSA